MENTFGTDPGDIGRPIQAFRKTQIVEFRLEKVPNYCIKCVTSGKIKISDQKYQRQNCMNHSEFGNQTWTYYR